MKQSKMMLDIGKITYFLWIVYFAAIYIRGNVNYQMPAWLSYFMFFYMVIYKLLVTGNLQSFLFSLKSVTIWYGGFYLWMVVARLWTPDAVVAKGSIPSQTLRILLILFAMDLYVFSSEDAYKLMKTFCVGASFFAVYVFITSPISSYGSLNFGAATGQHRNTTGYVLCFSSIMLVYLWKKYKNKWWLILAVPNVLSALLTGSRKIIFAYGMAFLIFIMGQKELDKRVKYFVSILCVAIVVIPIMYQIPYIKETFGERLLAVVDDSIEDSSIMYRNIAKENAVRIFKEKPIIGNGWAAVKNSFSFNGVSIYAHNNYLEVAADFGIIGCLLFFYRNFVYGLHFARKFRMSENNIFILILLCAMVMLDWGQVSFSYIYLMVIWGIVYKVCSWNY